MRRLLDRWGRWGGNSRGQVQRTRCTAPATRRLAAAKGAAGLPNLSKSPRPQADEPRKCQPRSAVAKASANRPQETGLADGRRTPHRARGRRRASASAAFPPPSPGRRLPRGPLAAPAPRHKLFPERQLRPNCTICVNYRPWLTSMERRSWRKGQAMASPVTLRRILLFAPQATRGVIS